MTAPAEGPARPTPDSWVAEHADALHRYARRRVATAHEAEDLVQETLLAGWRRLREAPDSPPDLRLLIGILKHKIADHYRRLFRERGAGDPHADLSAGDFAADGHWDDPRAPRAWPPADETDPRARFELREALDRCLAELPVAHARVFLLREVEQLDTAEIRELTGHSETNLFVMLHRARSALRRCLEKHLFPSDRPAR